MPELLNRIKKAAAQARLDIIINFEHLKQATPEALRLLADARAWQSIWPYARVRYRKFKAAFEVAVEELSVEGFEGVSDEVLDA
jgi:hypothetical protein